MTPKSEKFLHPHDTPVSAGLRFLSEVIAWVAGPWAAALVSTWLVIPTLVLLVGLPAVFSIRNDKNQVIVATPGTVRVGIELMLYSVAAIAPWFIWPGLASGFAAVVVVASLVAGIPRFLWLVKGAPLEE